MDTRIFITLKSNSFVDNGSQEVRSTLQLGITELISGNFLKAVDLSDEIIRKDCNFGEAWGLKALSQGYLFDYDDKLFYLKSSLQSLEEFKLKTKLNDVERINVEALFMTAVLNRTISLVNDKIGEVIQLRQQAQMEKTKASISKFGALMSAYAGSQSKSDVGKILGYGGAIAGAVVASKYDASAILLNQASKGVFGVAVANIAFTIDGAKALNNNINYLSSETKNESSAALINWRTAILNLYKQVILNLIIYAKEVSHKNVFTKEFRISALQLIYTPEAKQFIYLSRALGIDKKYSEIGIIEEKLNYLNSIAENDIKTEVKKMHIYAGGTIGLGILVAAAVQTQIVQRVRQSQVFLYSQV